MVIPKLAKFAQSERAGGYGLHSADPEQRKIRFACKGIFFCANVQIIRHLFAVLQHIVYDFTPYRDKSGTKYLCVTMGRVWKISAKAVTLHEH